MYVLIFARKHNVAMNLTFAITMVHNNKRAGSSQICNERLIEVSDITVRDNYMFMYNTSIGVS